MPHHFDYDSGCSPAMPVAEIAIGRAMSTPTLTLTALIDSGADATIIPVHFLRQVRARKRLQAWLRGPAMQRIRVDLYEISLQIGDHREMLLSVVGSADSDEIILGRDVLNQLIVTMNGLAAIVEISA